MADFNLEDVTKKLEGDWLNFPIRFGKLKEEEQKFYLGEQGFLEFRDLIGHVIAWWEEAHYAVCGIMDTPGFVWERPDTHAFNAESVERFKVISEEELWDYYEHMRQALVTLVEELDEDALLNEDIAGWLGSVVLRHYGKHALS